MQYEVAGNNQRTYPPTITLIRRSTGHPDLWCRSTTAADVEEWLLKEATAEDDTLRLVEQFAWRLVESGLGFDRLSLHTGTLHPQAIRNTWIWSRADGLCDEIRIAPGVLDDTVRDTPFRRARVCGQGFRGDTRNPDFDHADPILGDLPRHGLTHYAVLPLGARRHDRFDVLVVATARADGSSPDMLAACDRLFAVFALHVSRHVTAHVLTNVVRTYLGRDVGARILDGSIRRGSGQAGEAVIWFSDLRGFTHLTETRSSEIVLGTLDAYFEVMADAVSGADGEVLKFVGDGLLAGFPVSRFGTLRTAAEAAVSAARAATAGLQILQDRPAGSVANEPDLPPIRTGIALHAGQVFFGNVGAPDRLDFTVIGRAVNIAARVESLCGSLDRQILLTGSVASQIDEHLEDLGDHALKGISRPQRIYALGAHLPNAHH